MPPSPKRVVVLCQTAQLCSVRLQRDTLSSSALPVGSDAGAAGCCVDWSVYSSERLQRRHAVSRDQTNTGAVSRLVTPTALKNSFAPNGLSAGRAGRGSSC
jgi:hypothetical protein